MALSSTTHTWIELLHYLQVSPEARTTHDGVSVADDDAV